jgi:hypothetical protein
LAFHAQGWSIRQLAVHLDLNWRTVKRSIEARELPKRGALSIQRTASVRPYQACLEQRWAEGVPTAPQLWHALQERGYAGSRSRVSCALKPLGLRTILEDAQTRLLARPDVPYRRVKRCGPCSAKRMI